MQLKVQVQSATESASASEDCSKTFLLNSGAQIRLGRGPIGTLRAPSQQPTVEQPTPPSNAMHERELDAEELASFRAWKTLHNTGALPKPGSALASNLGLINTSGPPNNNQATASAQPVMSWRGAHKPPSSAASLAFSEHPNLALLQNERVQKLGLLKARITNIRNAIYRDTAKDTSGLPAYLVTAPVITVPCTHLFSDAYYKETNQMLLETSKRLSSRTAEELERIRHDLEGEYQHHLDSCDLTEEEIAAVTAIAAARTDQNIRIQDRPPIRDPSFLIRPDATKGHTLITPNPELRTLHKTASRIPSQRRTYGPPSNQQQDQRQRPRNPRGGYNQRGHRGVYPNQPTTGQYAHDEPEQEHQLQQNRDFQQSRFYRPKR